MNRKTQLNREANQEETEKRKREGIVQEVTKIERGRDALGTYEADEKAKRGSES